MSANLLATRKLIATVLKGDRPEEALARSAYAEVSTFSAETVEIAPNGEQPVHPQLAVTADEAIAALAPLFAVMETLMVELRDKTGGKVIMHANAANAFILAHHVLKKAGHEPVKHRKVEPFRFIQVVRQA